MVGGFVTVTCSQAEQIPGTLGTPQTVEGTTWVPYRRREAVPAYITEMYCKR